MSHPSTALRAPRAVSGLCLVACATVGSGAAAQAVLDPVVVTASRDPQRLSQTSADLVVIDTETIRNAGAESVESLLSREAGLQLSRNGGPGQSASVFIRGAGASSTLVLIDGVRVGSATLGQFSFESLSLSQIDRIEVLRGPGSSLYGADAVGGVVQIFTRRGAGEPRVTARAQVGGYHSSEADLGVSGAQAGFDYAASLGHERSDGVSVLRPGDQFGDYNPDHDGYSRRSADLSLGYTPLAGHRVGLKLVASKLKSQYDSSDFPPPDFEQDPSPDFRNRLETDVVALDYRGTLNEAWTTALQVSRNDDDLRSGGGTVSRFKTTRDQATWQTTWKFAPAQQILFAYDHLNEKAVTDSFDRKRDNNALVLTYSGTFGAQTLQADLRHDDNSAYGNNTTGRLGWRIDITPGLTLRALAGTTFRAPTFNDLYFPDYGVEGIRPERGRSVEVGADWHAGDSRAGVTLYRNNVRDLIAYQADATLCPPGFDFGCAGNTSRARLQGATFSAAQRWGGFGLRATVDLLDATDTHTGERLNRRAAQQETLAADYTSGAWNFSASLLNVGSRPDGGKRLGGYATLDLRASWRFMPQWRLEATLLNAADRDVEVARDYQGLGRQAWIGVRFDGRGL